LESVDGFDGLIEGEIERELILVLRRLLSAGHRSRSSGSYSGQNTNSKKRHPQTIVLVSQALLLALRTL
jgi:hypothetical protein